MPENTDAAVPSGLHYICERRWNKIFFFHTSEKRHVISIYIVLVDI